ncbi:hypothetical protein P154DRAFT_525507, partial [Amniculicola lignicola CBS 123094]
MEIKRRCAATLLGLMPARAAVAFFASDSGEEQAFGVWNRGVAGGETLPRVGREGCGGTVGG